MEAETDKQKYWEGQTKKERDGRKKKVRERKWYFMKQSVSGYYNH